MGFYKYCVPKGTEQKRELEKSMNARVTHVPKGTEQKKEIGKINECESAHVPLGTKYL